MVPRTLAENAGQSAADVISALYAAHAGADASSAVGVDIDEGGVMDALAGGVVDSLAVKLSALRLASDAAVTILRVDQIIMSKQAGGPKPRKPQAPDM